MTQKKSIRAAVLDAAFDLVETSGAAILTLDAVAAKAGVSKGGLLHHFNSKEALLKAMMARVADDFARRSKKAIEEVHTAAGDSSARRLELLSMYLQRSFSGKGAKSLSAMGLFAVAAHQPKLVEPIREFFTQRAEETIKHMENPAAAMALVMLADGLWLFDALNIAPFKGKLREQVRDIALRWARETIEAEPMQESLPLPARARKAKNK